MSGSSSQHVRVEIGDDHVCRITLQRPEAKNALSIEMRDTIVDAVRSARTDPDVRAVLITGTGDAFCAGMDLSASTVSRAGTGDFDNRSTSEALRVGVQAFIRELWELDKPTVAAINGVAVGPGAHLALACDFVLVHDDTRLMWSFAKWGLVVDAGGAYLLPRLVGLPRAKAMVMLGEGCKGAEAVDLGLAYRCVAPDALEDEASTLAARLAAGPTRSLGLSKRLLNESFETDLTRALELEGAFQALATSSADLAEGMGAFKERRDPRFTGR
jgi:2-(1,2-epoxy-1,2-dihydrophenyl)acetyl-CoA isomerase